MSCLPTLAEHTELDLAMSSQFAGLPQSRLDLVLCSNKNFKNGKLGENLQGNSACMSNHFI